VKQQLIALYGAMFAIANIAAVKVVTMYGISITAGTLPIAIAFLLSDIGVERYGREFGHKLANAGLISLVLTVGVLFSVGALPGESVVNEVVNFSLPILAASITTLAVSQHTDVVLFSYIKQRLPYRFTRNIGSTITTQLLDTALFTVLGFAVYPFIIGGQQLPIAVITSIIVADWIIKCVIAIVDTPIFYAFTQSPSTVDSN